MNKGNQISKEYTIHTRDLQRSIERRTKRSNINISYRGIQSRTIRNIQYQGG